MTKKPTAPPPPAPPPEEKPARPTWLEYLRRYSSATIAFVSHVILIWILSLWYFLPMLQQKEKEIPFPIQVIVPGVEGNTDDALADDAFEPAEEAAAPTEEVVEKAEERKRDVPVETPKETPKTIGYGEPAEELVEDVPVPLEDLDERAVLDALESSQKVATRAAPAFSNRNSDGRGQGVGKYGGSEATEAAVEMGLAWLAAHQSADGRWDSNHFNRLCPAPEKCTGSGLMSYDPAQTGLAVLAFLGAGYVPGRGTYGDRVARGLEFLLAEQNDAGLMGNGDLYNHAIATFALAEAYGMTRDRRLRRPIQSAVQYLVDAQQPSGGWSYTAKPREERNDSSITGFVVMALKAALVSGIHVPAECFAGAIRHFQRMTDTSTGIVTYADGGPQKERQGEGLVAVSLLSRLLLGQATDEPVIHHSVARLTANPPNLDRRDSIDNSEYYWYYGTLAMFHVGGRPWDNWNEKMIRCIVPHQIRGGHRAGSWEPDTKWGPNGGRLYETSINVLTLEIYYKYAPGYMQQMPDLARVWHDPATQLGSGPANRRRGDSE